MDHHQSREGTWWVRQVMGHLGTTGRKVGASAVRRRVGAGDSTDHFVGGSTRRADRRVLCFTQRNGRLRGTQQHYAPRNRRYLVRNGRLRDTQQTLRNTQRTLTRYTTLDYPLCLRHDRTRL